MGVPNHVLLLIALEEGNDLLDMGEWQYEPVHKFMEISMIGVRVRTSLVEDVLAIPICLSRILPRLDFPRGERSFYFFIHLPPLIITKPSVQNSEGEILQSSLTETSVWD